MSERNDKQLEDLEKYWCIMAWKLAFEFKKDAEACIRDFPSEKKVELFEHFLQCFALAEDSFLNNDDLLWRKVMEEEDAFHKRQGNRLKTYITKNFVIYYGTEDAILRKGLVTKKEWDKLPDEKKYMPSAQLLSYFGACKEFVRGAYRRHWLEHSPDDEKKGKSDSEHPLGETGKNAAKKAEERRKAKDSATKLSEEQTVLLIHYLQAQRLLLQDGSLNKKDAGIAFSILTGYSHETIRQDLGKLDKLNTLDNLFSLMNQIEHLHTLIATDYKKERDKKNNNLLGKGKKREDDV